jgi:hypothetical protein
VKLLPRLSPFLNLLLKTQSENPFLCAPLNRKQHKRKPLLPFNCAATKMKKTSLLPVVAAHAAALRAGAGFFVEPITGAAFFHAPLLSPIRR